MSERSGSDGGGDGRAGTSTDEGEGEPRPFIDSVFDALADWRRREVCEFFRETDVSTATVDELAMVLASCEPELNEGPSERTHGDLTAELEEVHLPRLDAAGVVDYDDRTDTVRYWGQPTVEKWLEHVSAVERREC